MDNNYIKILNRNSVIITGVTEAKSFDEQEVHLMVADSELVVYGEKLHVDGLSLEKGEILISGLVNGLSYSESLIRKKKRGK